MAVSEEQFKDRSFIKTLLVILISFISLPLIVITIMYFTNEGFQENANKILSTLPGKTGGYFQSIPTKDEQEDLKKNIAKHYITLDEDRIIDKLLIIKGEDEQLFNDLVILMTKENSTKMKKVKENLQVLKFNKDPFNRILNEIDEENEQKINDLQKYYTSLNLVKAVHEIERTHYTNEVTIDELANLFKKLKSDQAAKYLFYLNPELGRQIKFRLPKSNLENIEKGLEDLENKQQKLLEVASIYENKPIEESVTQLGNFDKYNAVELAFIFKNITLNKSSKILSKVDDNEFMSTLFNEINHLEQLLKDMQNTSSIIAKGIAIYKDYEQKINELASIYQKTDIVQLTKMIETMLKRNEIYMEYPLGDFEQIIFTEEKLVIDVLNRLKANTVAQILENLNENNKIILSKKLLQ